MAKNPAQLSTRTSQFRAPQLFPLATAAGTLHGSVTLELESCPESGVGDGNEGSGLSACGQALVQR